jgi:2-iminobutanoate/2-iminopropanoate deaminase
MIKPIQTPNAPAAVGPYSQGIVSGGFVFASGCLPLDPATGIMVEGTIADKATRALENLKAVAEAGGSSLAKAVKVTVFLADIADFADANKVYAEYFKEPYPARSAFQVGALPFGAAIEIEAIFAV